MDVTKAKSLLRADYRPPARRWDILNDCLEGAQMIILIDGVFLDEYPPSPKELASVLKEGIKVWGCSSMGALRAVELRKLGMKGSGIIYNQYLSRQVEDDDEVAVVFNNTTNKAYSYALINLRYTLNILVNNNLLDKDDAKKVFDNQKSIYFPDRNFLSIKYSCIDIFGEVKGLRIYEMIKSNWIDLKKVDAEILLRFISEQGSWRC